ncbi:MAG: hypothetical protein H0A75_05520 [Candidatus Methanofishera endochildressiae]|uniref:DEAD-box RNA helicase Q domain-containing protein n=1 Tax=Candidatus Methanofishera endochildressiae TaxID=2738884 RepID=A0A7Z0SDU4_9GAMM|nr:hypothetical protein [Candidatus Methanofishera endochildressiae]
MKKTHLTDTRFINLELSKSILKGLKDAGFDQCSPIQDQSLPIALRDRDAGKKRKREGKRRKFFLAAFQRLLKGNVKKKTLVHFLAPPVNFAFSSIKMRF